MQTNTQAADSMAELLNRCCTELPEGYGIVVSVERGCGAVTWIDPSGEEFDIEGEGYLSDDLVEAFDACIADAPVAARNPAAADWAAIDMSGVDMMPLEGDVS